MYAERGVHFDGVRLAVFVDDRDKARALRAREQSNNRLCTVSVGVGAATLILLEPAGRGSINIQRTLSRQ